jgi:hypothetical protein
VWERHRIGISYGLYLAETPSLTIFAHANQLFPTDGVARLRLLGLAAQIGGALPLYERVTQLLEGIAMPHVMHTLVGIKISGSGKVALTVGLRPFQVKVHGLAAC